MKSKKIKWGINLALMLAATLTGLCLFEFVLQFSSLGRISTEPQFFYSPSSTFGWELTKGFKGRFKTSEFNTGVDINSQGFRDAEHALSKAPGVYRILGLGDSFTFGYGVEFESTYLRLLEKALNEDSQRMKFEIIKTGVPGYSLKQEAAFLETKGFAYQPDLVLIGFDINDHVDSLMPYYEIHDGYMVRNETARGFFFRERLYLLTHFRSMHLIFKTIQMLKDYFWRGTDEIHLNGEVSKRKFKEEAFQYTDEKLGELQRKCKERNIRLVLIFIPHRSQVHPDKFKPKPFNYFFYDLDQHLMRVCEKYEIPYINLLPDFLLTAQTKKMLHFSMDGHWNDAGHQLAAKIIKTRLQESGVFQGGEKAA